MSKTQSLQPGSLSTNSEVEICISQIKENMITVLEDYSHHRCSKEENKIFDRNNKKQLWCSRDCRIRAQLPTMNQGKQRDIRVSIQMKPHKKSLQQWGVGQRGSVYVYMVCAHAHTCFVYVYIYVYNYICIYIYKCVCIYIYSHMINNCIYRQISIFTDLLIPAKSDN